MCFVDLEKAYGCVSQGDLWGALQEYGLDCLLLWAIHSLYRWSQCLDHIAGSGLDLFSVRVGLCQDNPLPPVPFLIFMDAVCCGEERAEPEGKAFNLQVNLHPNSHLQLSPKPKEVNENSACNPT